MPLDLLHFGSGIQALHYFFLAYVSVVGTIQAAATRSKFRELVWIQGTSAYWLGGLLVSASFLWFLLVDDEIFIPGLAGGELFALFAAAFFLALFTTRIISVCLTRLRVPSATSLAQDEELLP